MRRALASMPRGTCASRARRGVLAERAGPAGRVRTRRARVGAWRCSGWLVDSRAVRVLLSNDDGVHAPGIARARRRRSPSDEVWVVAPDREQSASSHAISLHRPLRVVEVEPRWFAVDGTPTDAVYMGLNLVLREARPDVVVSGVNHGPNLGNDVLYSGTVAAAMEAALLGVQRHRGLARRAAAARVRRTRPASRPRWPARVVARRRRRRCCST